MTSNQSDWDLPWSTEEIISKANNWNLAGDVALLNSIKSFADKLLSNSSTISDNLDNLLNDLDTVGLQLDLSKNKLQSLRNTQFIECRVYEDDETLSSTEPTVKVEEKVPTEAENNKIVLDSVRRGLDVINKYFVYEEGSNQHSSVLKPKNLYLDRPLPPVIGTEEWDKSFNVGSYIAHKESDNNDNKADEIRKTEDSESSSELDLSTKTDVSKPLANSTINDDRVNQENEDIFPPNVNEQSNIEDPLKSLKISNSISEELASKLGTILQKPKDVEPEINKKPIQPASKFIGLFSDEPPLLEDEIVPKHVNTGIFSGGTGLFDDNEDDLFDQQNNHAASKQPSEVSDQPRNQQKIRQVTKGLFDSDESSDDDIFTTLKNNQLKTKTYLPVNQAAVPLVDEEPPLLDDPKLTANKGAIKKKSDIGSKNETLPQKASSSRINNDSDIHINKQISNSEVPNSIFDNANKLPEKERTERKKISLFTDEDDDDLFRDDLFAPMAKKKISSLFDDDDDDFFSTNTTNTAEVNIFSGLPENIDTKTQTKKHYNLFDDEINSEIEQKDDIINFKPPSSIDDKFSKKNLTNLFDDDINEIDFNNKNSINVDADLENDSVETKIKVLQSNSIEQTKESKIESDNFKSTTIFDELSDTTSENLVKESTASHLVGLFDSVPPADDGDNGFDTKSDNSFDGGEINSYNDFASQPSSLFDHEPPVLSCSESGIVIDQSITRVDFDGSSFGPKASSSKRLSSDIFYEQQSDDSFFVTKNTMDFSTAPPDLSNTKEISVSSASYIDITASGKLEELNSGDISSVFEDTSNLQDGKEIIENKNINKDNRTNTSGTENMETEQKRSLPEIIKEGKSTNVKVSPGKLKHNLNINVKALIPGSVPFRKDLVKSHSLEISKDEVDESISQSSMKISSDTLGKTDQTDLFTTSDATHVLHSITKDRVRNTNRRKPSTRRGRQEYLRKSTPDFTLAINDDEINASGNLLSDKLMSGSSPDVNTLCKSNENLKDENNSTKLQSEPKIEDSNLGSHDLFSDVNIGEQNENATKVPSDVAPSDLFHSKTKSSKNIFEDDSDDLFSTFPKTTKSTTNSLFDSPESEDNLFNAQNKFEPVVSKENKILVEEEENVPRQSSKLKDNNSSIFDDGSSDEDIFSSKKIVTKKTEIKKSLFEDDDEDDNIFGSGKDVRVTNKKSDAENKTVDKTTKTVSKIRRLENIETSEDPLSSLFK